MKTFAGSVSVSSAHCRMYLNGKVKERNARSITNTYITYAIHYCHKLTLNMQT